MTTLPVIIIAVAACLLGGATGAMWGLGEHRHIYDWLSANIISRMQQAMRSCGYRQDEIDMVTQRMGMRIMPPHILCPPPPEKKEQAENQEANRLRLEDIVTWMTWGDIKKDDLDIIDTLTSECASLIVGLAETLRETEGSCRCPEYFYAVEQLTKIADRLLDQWQRRTKEPYTMNRMHVTIDYRRYVSAKEPDTGKINVIYYYDNELS